MIFDTVWVSHLMSYVIANPIPGHGGFRGSRLLGRVDFRLNLPSSSTFLQQALISKTPCKNGTFMVHLEEPGLARFAYTEVSTGNSVSPLKPRKTTTADVDSPLISPTEASNQPPLMHEISPQSLIRPHRLLEDISATEYRRNEAPWTPAI